MKNIDVETGSGGDWCCGAVGRAGDFPPAEGPPAPGTTAAAEKAGANARSLTCNVGGGVGFVFGSSKDVSCLFTRTNGVVERYTGVIKKYGVDIGVTKEAQIVWLIFARAALPRARWPASMSARRRRLRLGGDAGANVLVGGGGDQVTLQPVSVEGNVGLNVAAGIASVELKYVK